MLKNKSQKQIGNSTTGFTILELMAVVGIIILLSTAVLATFYKVRSDARDSKRVASIAQIQTALEAYFRDHNIYPLAITPGQPLTSLDGNLEYMGEVPHNVEPWAEGNCPNSDFFYNQTNGGESYTLDFCLVGQTANLSAGLHQATPGGIQ